MTLSITWIGHATFLLQTAGVNILTDPWFSQNLLMRRVQPPALTPEKVPPCQIILVSHNHGDHWDKQGQELARRWRSTVIGPPSVINKSRRMGLVSYEAVPGRKIEVQGVLQVEPVTAYHPAPGAKDAVGYLFHLNEKWLYFAGDTLPTDALKQTLKDTTVDLAFLPVGAFRLFGKKVTMDVKDALDLAHTFKPLAVIPMHYGFLKGTSASIEELKVLEDEGIKVYLPLPGEVLKIKG